MSECLILVFVIGMFRIFQIRVLGLLRRRLLFGFWKRQDMMLLSVMQEILSTQKLWTERMLALEEERLRLERLRLEGAQPLSGVPMGHLRVSEDEQDLDWALNQGLVTPQEYKDLLEKTGLVPTDLQLL
jgi:hypothetical protein